MTVDEKISHIVSRLQEWNRNGNDNFNDVEQLIDIEYSVIFFQMLSVINASGSGLSKKLVQQNPNIGSVFMSFLRNEETTQEHKDWSNKFVCGYYEEDIYNNEIYKNLVEK